MRKSSFLIGLMVLALTALVALQGYWILNAYQAQKEQFDRTVKTALLETVRKIEQEEVTYVARQRLANQQLSKLQKVTKETESFNDAFLKKKIWEHDIVLNSIYNETFFREFSDKLNNLGEKVPENRERATDYINQQLKQENENLKSFIKSNETLEKKYDEIKELNRSIDSVSLPLLHSQSLDKFPTVINLDLVKGIIHDLMLGERSVAERMGHIMLDTLLKEELWNLGIKLPFQYSVEEKGKVVMASPDMIKSSDGYKVRMFPGDSFQNNQVLNVQFPDKGNFIFLNLLGLFGLSTLLVVLVGGVFYYAATSLISERRLAKVKNDFINNMTHELKTPVSSISLAVQAIEDKDVPAAKTERYLEIIKEENSRLGLQIEKVLQMAQNEVQVNLETLDVHVILESVKHNMEVQLHDTVCKMKLEAFQTRVMGDKVHLTNIFYNLIDNAIKYSKKTLELEIHTGNTANHEIQIDIKDNGIGIAPEEIPRVFDNFYRVSTGDVHDVKGFGLGLSYVKKMAEMHKGSVKLVSKPGLGSTFTIKLPLE